MGILIYKEKFYCAKYHRERLKGKDFIELDDTLQDALCGSLCNPLMSYNKDTHEWKIIDKKTSIYHLMFKAGLIISINGLVEEIEKLKEYTGYNI